MGAQQEVPIGDDDLDALMDQLEQETAGMVAAPPSVVKTTVVEDDPLAGLDDEISTETPAAIAGTVAVELNPTDPRDNDPLAGLDEATQLEKSIAQANAGEAKPRELVEPNVEDELAALEAEMGDAVGKTPNAMDKLNAVAAAARKTYPSDIPKAPAELPEPTSAPEKTTDEELDATLASLSATMPKQESTKVVERLQPPEPPNPDPAEVPEPPPAGTPAGLRHFIDVDQFRRDIAVSETNLDNCMMQQAGLVAYYVQQAALAEAQHLRLKARFGVLEAQLYDNHRKMLAAKSIVDPTFKVTEKAVENAVRTDPKWLKNNNVVIEAESIATINKGLVESLKQRRDMIIQLGADRREEGKGAARTVAAAQAHEDLKSRAVAMTKGQL